MSTAVAAPTGEVVQLVSLEFSGGTLRLCTAGRDLEWAGETWTAVGGRVEIAPVVETSDLSDGGVQIALSGVTGAVLPALLTNQYIGRRADVWLVHLDPLTGQIVPDPVLLFRGALNGGWQISESRPSTPGEGLGGAVGTVNITGRCTGRLSELDQRRGIQTNIGAHQAVYPGDQFFAYVGQLGQTPIVWKPA